MIYRRFPCLHYFCTRVGACNLRVGITYLHMILIAPWRGKCGTDERRAHAGVVCLRANRPHRQSHAAVSMHFRVCTYRRIFWKFSQFRISERGTLHLANIFPLGTFCLVHNYLRPEVFHLKKNPCLYYV